ncbi:MAG: ABC transporter substrate binding protein [Lachnospiraceae bacterium]|nr:ABC transporter substrate binding protein [Lachnospiraceae bacterium]
MNCIKRLGIIWVTVLMLFASVITCNAKEGETVSHPRVLFISAYAYDWDSVPDQLKGVAEVLGSKAKMDYMFMDTKKHTYDEVKQGIHDEIQTNIDEAGQYHVVMAEDDAALDFALEYRDDLFAGVPIVFMGINTIEKAESAHEDPLITGMVEFFPYQDTIALARKLYPEATKIVGISDNTESGLGCTKRFYDEAEHFPELEFSDMNTSEMTEDQIADLLATYDESTILVFLSFINDVDGNIYSLLEATEFVADHAQIPMFKSDYLGVGEGVFGGYVSSYEEMSGKAADMALEILTGKAPADIPVETMSGYPIFDQNMLNRFKIDSKLLPENAVIVNYVPTFMEQYSTVIWPGVTIIAFLLLLIIFIVIYNRKQALLKAVQLKSEAQNAYLKLEEEKNTQLEAAIIQAEKASRAKSDYLSRMSHEIRTPINAIIGETTLAQKNIHSTGKVEEYLKQILISSKHLLNLINDVLDMSAIESDKIKIAHVDFDLKEVVATVTTLYYSQCKTKGIHFEAKMNDVKTEILVGDQLRLQQVILNLLSNAYKFTDKGGSIFLRMKEEKIDEDHVKLHIQVQDTGCGMSEEYMSRIFKPFEQESSLTAKEHGGSGLGLSISKNLIEMMQGSILVESKVGAGTIFTIDIPYEIAECQMKIDVERVSDMKIMVIDDDEESLEYISNILNHIGMEHTCESDAEVAFEKMAKARNDGDPYELCLVDWKMEGMDGLEVSKRIRLAQGDDAVIIVVSAYDTNEIADATREVGVNACISKPLFQSTLFDTLMSICEGSLVHDTAKTQEYDFTGKKLLLADDIEINREMAKELLTMVGFEVDLAADGAEAIAQFKTSEAGTNDAILMDVQMPNVNGYEATRQIRDLDHPQAKDIPIIAMTANAFVEDIAKSLEAGMNDHLSKPIDTEAMYQLLRRYVEK